MNSTSFYAKRVHPVVYMALVTIFCILITAALHLSTLERVQQNELFFLRKSVLDAAGIAHNGDPLTVASLYAGAVTEQEGGTFYAVKTTDGNQRYVLPFTGPGLWGPISVMIGFETDLQTLSGVSIVSQSETPGLGARIEEEWYVAQFAGKRAPFRNVEEGTASKPDEIDAITGATRTSESFRDIVNKAAVESKNIVGVR